MKKLTEKISFLQGLGQGMNIMESGPQGKLIIEMLEVMSDLAGNLNELRRDFDDFKIYVESIDDDLFSLEENMYGEEDDDFVEVTCQNCGENVYFEAIYLDDEDVIEIICPRCNEVVYINDGHFDTDVDVSDDPLESSRKHSSGVSPTDH